MILIKIPQDEGVVVMNDNGFQEVDRPMWINTGRIDGVTTADASGAGYEHLDGKPAILAFLGGQISIIVFPQQASVQGLADWVNWIGAH